MRGRKESCGLSEAIQNLPPELREMLLKEYITIKIKEKKEMGWDGVNRRISGLPVCGLGRRIVRMVICLDCANCCFEGCCFPCFGGGGAVHGALVGPPNDPEHIVEAGPDCGNFLEICSWNGCDWHEWFFFGPER